jgi:hypothetical protein
LEVSYNHHQYIIIFFLNHDFSMSLFCPQLCGPQFADFRFERLSSANHTFTVGRCQFVPNQDKSQGVMPYTENPTKTYTNGSGLIAGMAMFGFSATGNGVSLVIELGPVLWGFH